MTTYYNPCNLEEAKEIVKEYCEDGLNAALSTIRYRIIRETSKYNKYIKWFLRTFREDGTILSSAGYRTRKEAVEIVTKPRRPMPIGNRFSVTFFEEI